MLAAIAALVLLPFSIGNFLKGCTLTGVLSMAVVLIFVADAAAAYRAVRLPFPLSVVFAAIMVGLAAAIWQRGWVNVSTVCIDGYVGLEEIDDGIWNVYFGPLRLGRLHDRHMKIDDAYGRLARHGA